MMRFKKLLTLLLSVMLLLSAVACNGGKNPDSSYGDGNVITPGQTLTVWASVPIHVTNYSTILGVDPENKDALLTKEIVKTFEEQYDCKVKLVNKGWDADLNENLLKAIKTNETVDVVCGERYIDAYMQEGYFAEIDLGDMEDDIVESALAPGQLKGKTYAVPVLTGSFGLCISKKSLRQAGIIDENDAVTETYKAKYEAAGINPLAPKYWEDLLVICQDIDAHYADNDSYGGIVMNTTESGSSWRSLAYMRSAGAEIFDKEQDKFVIDSQNATKAYEMMRALNATSPKNSIYFTHENELMQQLYQGFASYMVEGVDFLINSAGRGYESDMIVTELPVFKGVEQKSNVLVGTVYYSVMEESKHKALAKEFVKHLLKEEFQIKYLENNYRVPTSKAALASEALTACSNYGRMQAFFAPFSDSDYSFKGGIPSLSKNSSLVWESWHTFIKKMYTDTGKSVGEIATEYCADMNGKYKR